MSTMNESPTEPIDGGMPDDELTGHNYDGIQEFDNPLPGWWKWLFIGTIIFAFPYAMYFHSGAEGRTRYDAFDTAVAENMKLQFAEIGEVEPNRENVIKFLGRPNWLAFGKNLYKANCTSCHGADGGGLVGPNLCDDHYKNIKDIGDFITVLENGAAGGAMPAWKNRLETNEIVMLASYAASLRGSEPADPKPPLGQIIPEWPTPPPPEEEKPAADESTEEKAEEAAE